MKLITAALALMLATTAHAADSVYVEPGTFTPAGLGNQILCDCQDYMQWHLNFTHTREAWQVHTGIQGFKVGVISTGIDTVAFDLGGPYADGSPHPHPNMWRNPNETPYNGLDDDGNGYVDDYRGFSFAEGTSTPYVGDHWGTGTAIAGTMAAEGPASAYRGVGIAQNLTIVPIKMFTGGLAFGADWQIAALRYARTVGCKITVTHGGTNGVYQPMKDEIALNTAAGMLTVWASGGGTPGGNIDQCPEPCSLPGSMYPQKFTDPGLLVVASAALTNGFGTQEANVQNNTNWGPVSVDLAAPTFNANTLPNPPGPIQPFENRGVMTIGPGEQWVAWDGRSDAAAAMVAGAAALVWGAHPEFTAAEVKSIIMASVDTYPGLAGKCVTGGMLNVQRACAMADSIAGGGQIESVGSPVAAPIAPPTDGKVYDVQGRRVDPSYQGVQYGARKRVVVKP